MSGFGKQGDTVDSCATADGKPPGAFGLPNVVQVSGPEQLPALILAPDGVMRSPLKIATKYIYHTTFPWPRILLPRVTDPSIFSFTEIEASSLSVAMLIDGDDTPHIWGRNVGGFSMDSLQVIDVSNFFAGRGTVLFDLVGSIPFSFWRIPFCRFASFKKLGSLVDFAVQVNETNWANPESGFVIRVNPAFEASHFFQGLRLDQPSGAAVMVKPGLCLQGSPRSVAIANGNIAIGADDVAICIEETATGEYDILGNSVASGIVTSQFIAAPDVGATITKMEPVDIAISSFADSTVDPGVDTTIAVGIYTALTVGQVILIEGGGSVTGLRTITRVDATERFIDVDAAFDTDTTGDIKITRFTTSVATGLTENETLDITGTTSYNFKRKTLFATAFTFDFPTAFVANDVTGTGTTVRRDETSVGVNLLANGDQKDSKSIGGSHATDNAAVTVIDDQNTWVDLNFTLAVVSSNTERWELANATTGEVRYVGDRPFNGQGVVSLSAISSGGAQRFQFRLVKNGAPLPDGIKGATELTSLSDAVPVVTPVTAVTNDLFRPQTQNIDGTSNVTIEQFSMVIQ